MRRPGWTFETGLNGRRPYESWPFESNATCHVKLIAVCMYCLVMISIDLSETAKKNSTGNPGQNLVQIKSKNFFSNKIIFSIKKKFLDFVSD